MFRISISPKYKVTGRENSTCAVFCSVNCSSLLRKWTSYSPPLTTLYISLFSLQLWLLIKSVLTLRNSISVAYILWSNPRTFTTDLIKCWNSWNLSSPFVAPHQHPAGLGGKTHRNNLSRNLKVMKLFLYIVPNCKLELNSREAYIKHSRRYLLYNQIMI